MGARMAFVHSVFGNIAATWVSLLSIAAMMWGIERLFSKQKISTASQLRSLVFWLVAGFASAIATSIFDVLDRHLGPRPILVIPLRSWLASPWIHWSMYIVAPLLGMILYDFFGYWLHRAQHKWFWSLHAVHHSIEELSGINSYFHWTEPFFRILFISLPAAYVVGIDGLESIFLIELLVKVQGYYLHTPCNIHLGPLLRRVIADNRFHRVHHSVEPRHFNTNFAAGTTLWDQLFGTAYFPAEDEWPEVGVVGEPPARTLNEYLWGPFQRLQASAPVASTESAVLS
jgi:sterol desaturase/sphingolipid hydroxylase (fatty acid hydroxylase superfamily)